jgi:guanylate kinase
MLRETYKLQRIVSFTTRLPRVGERQSEDYYFLSYEEALRKKSDGELAEYITFGEHYYGILATEIECKLAMGHTVAVVEPHGVKQLKTYCEEKGLNHKTVFITNPPNVLMARFLKRFREDVSAKPLDYAARVVNMVKSEQDWIFDHDYDMIFTSFDSSNENWIVQQIYAEIARS